MTVPTIRVEVAFGLGAYSEPLPGDWVDITADVLEIHTQRGRSSEFERFPAGTCTVVLVNDDRQYDPLNSAGAYYGDLVPNAQIQVVATISAVDYPLWTGYVDGWPAEYTDAGYRSEVQVRCTDAFKLLAERPMPDTWLHYLQLNDIVPPTWYPCDTITGGVIENIGTVGQPFVAAASVQEVPSLQQITGGGALLLPAQTSPGLSIAETSYCAVAPVLLDTRDNPTAGTTFTISALIRTEEVKDKGILCTLDVRPIQVVEFGLFVVGVNLVARLAVNTDGGLSADNTILGSTNLADGNTHHVVGVRDGTTLSVYVDGGLDGTSTVGGASGSMEVAPGTMQLGRGWTPANGPSGAITIDEIMVWPTAFTAPEVQALHSVFTSGLWPPLLSGEAVSEILDEISWGGYLSNIDTGETMVQLPQQPGGISALELMQRVTTTEAGRLFVNHRGWVTFHGRSRYITDTNESTIRYTFSAQTRDTAPTGVGIRDGTLSITVDDRITYDAAELTREGGTTQTAELTATHTRTYTASGLLHTSDLQTLGLANWIVFRYSTPQPRSDTWEIDPETMPDDWDNILTLDIGHRIKHDITPGGIGSSINLEQHLSLIAHDITPERWIITMNGTPTDPNEAAYFLWATVVTADDDNGWADTDGTPPGGYWG